VLVVPCPRSLLVGRVVRRPGSRRESYASCCLAASAKTCAQGALGPTGGESCWAFLLSNPAGVIRIFEQLAEHSQCSFRRIIVVDDGRIRSELAPHRDFSIFDVIVANMGFPAKLIFDRPMVPVIVGLRRHDFSSLLLVATMRKASSGAARWSAKKNLMAFATDSKQCIPLSQWIF